MRNRAMYLLTAALVALLALGAASGAEPLILMDCEGADAIAPVPEQISTEQAKTGNASLKWHNSAQTTRIQFRNTPTDWSAYNQLAFWLYSATANDAILIVNVGSENQETEGPDYYTYRITLNYTGWRRIEIPLFTMSPSRKPLGWQNVSFFAIYSKGWDIEPKEDTVVYIDDMRLEYADIKLRNLSFEDSPTGPGGPHAWNTNPGPDGETTFVRVVAQGKEGQGVEIVDNNPKQGVGIEQVIPAETGKTYRMRAWKKGDVIALYIKFLDEAQNKIDEKIAAPNEKNPDSFKPLEVELGNCPPEAKFVQFWIYSFISNQGTIVVDEVEITKTD